MNTDQIQAQAQARTQNDADLRARTEQQRADEGARKARDVRPPYNLKSPVPFTKDDVQALIADINKLDNGEKIVLGEPYLFGLALDVFDPVSERVIAVARPPRRDLGEEEIWLTAEQVAAEVAAARAGRLNHDRVHGVVRPLSDAEQKTLDEQREAERAEAERKAAKAA